MKLTGRPLHSFASEPSPVGLRYGGVDIWAVGAAGAQGTDEKRLDDGSRAGVYQAVSRCGEQTVGVQMIGTREGFDELTRTLVL